MSAEILRARPFTETEADAIFKVLVDSGGADPAEADTFRWVLIANHAREYRFRGKLGFGGKLYWSRNNLRVAYYAEDQTPERDELAADLNHALARLSRAC